MDSKTLNAKEFILQKPRGTRDFFEDELVRIEFTTKLFFDVANRFGFKRIETPYFEDTRLYLKANSLDTDLIGKEMYDLTRGGERLMLSLRPEFTPGIARAYIENGMSSEPQPVKLASVGPVFRHDRPQKGRFRDPRQLNLEVIGSESPLFDALILLLVETFFKEIGIDNPHIKVSSTGDKNCRPVYTKKLKAALTEFKDELCPDCQRRLEYNPLRVLDCKNPNCRQIVQRAPSILDSLCKECDIHLKLLLEHLDNFGIEYEVDPYLVRGLDYYTKTVFEIFTEKENLALGGGGRYDGLLELYGAQPTPALGIALGLDRVLEAAPKKRESTLLAPDVFVIVFGSFAKKKADHILVTLAHEGFSFLIAPDKDSLRSQLKAANQAGSKFSIIIGQREAQANQAILRDMKSGQQENIGIEHLVAILRSKLN